MNPDRSVWFVLGVLAGGLGAAAIEILFLWRRVNELGAS